MPENKAVAFRNKNTFQYNAYCFNGDHGGRGGFYPEGNSVYPRGSSREEVSAQGVVSTQTPTGPRGRHPLVNRMTYGCENLTFPLQKPIHTVRQMLKQNSFSHFSNLEMISSLEFFAFDGKFAKLAMEFSLN